MIQKESATSELTLTGIMSAAGPPLHAPLLKSVTHTIQPYTADPPPRPTASSHEADWSSGVCPETKGKCTLPVFFRI